MAKGAQQFPVPEALKRQIRARYDCECAACGEKGDLTADVAHLYEDASLRPATPDRLIVLCAGCNQAEDRAKYDSKPALAERFDAESVSLQARRSYRKGRYPTAYQGHRLAAYLWLCRAQYSKAVASLVDAVSAARPIRWGDLLGATLEEAERLIVSTEVGIVQRWLLLDRLALTLFDYRRWHEAPAVQDAAARVREQVRHDPRDPDQLWFDRASSLRREALTQSFGRRAGWGRTHLHARVASLLRDAAEFRKKEQFDAAATNLDVAGKITAELLGDPAKAHEYAEEALAYGSKVGNKWVLQEHHWRVAAYYHAKRDRPRMLASVTDALRLFASHPVVLEPILSEGEPFPRDPIVTYRRYGVDEGELRDRGVAPQCNALSEISLALSPRAVSRLVASCL